MSQAQGAILSQKSRVKDAISPSARVHVHPQTEMLCLMSPTNSSSDCWPRAHPQGWVLGELWLSAFGLSEADLGGLITEALA